MNRLLSVVAASGVIFIGPIAIASESGNQSTLSKRDMIAQIVGCMKKRMSADKYTSYNETMKICKNQVNKGNDSSPSGPLVAADAPAKP
jgi:hypothetical protein